MCVRGLSYHVESEEPVTQEHLYFLVVSGQIAVRIAAAVLVETAPFVSRGGEFVRRQGARAGSEAASQDDAFLSVPLLVVLQYPRVARQILRRQLRKLIRLRVEPAQRLQVVQELVLGQRCGQMYLLMRSPLRRHHYTANLLHLRIVGRAHAVHVAGDLCSQVGDADELLQDVLRHDVRVSRFLLNGQSTVSHPRETMPLNGAYCISKGSRRLNFHKFAITTSVPLYSCHMVYDLTF